MKTISVKVAGGVQKAGLIRENPKTVIVRLRDGNEIKRHKEKYSPVARMAILV